ncbi:MAG: hypothetical protein M3P24_09415 [Gemmatimonadota bacterium]|nr:hypothetical protein [Gemmatimonadota bacterium]
MRVENIAERLGGAKGLKREIRSELDLAEAIHEGLSYQSLDHVLMSDDLEPNEAYELVGSRRTLMRKKKERMRLSPAESDRLARVVRIIARAEEALGIVTRPTGGSESRTGHWQASVRSNFWTATPEHGWWSVCSAGSSTESTAEAEDGCSSGASRARRIRRSTARGRA